MFLREATNGEAVENESKNKFFHVVIGLELVLVVKDIDNVIEVGLLKKIGELAGIFVIVEVHSHIVFGGSVVCI